MSYLCLFSGLWSHMEEKVDWKEAKEVGPGGCLKYRHNKQKIKGSTQGAGKKF